MTEELLRNLTAGLAVVQNQQVEINRRLANIETDLDEADERRLQELQTAQENHRNWVEEIMRLVVTAVILTALSWVAGKLGLDFVSPA